MFGLFRHRDQKGDPGLIASGGKPRSPRWSSWLKRFLVGKTCVVCGADDDLTGHHVIPFHEDPSLELDESNVEPVCRDVCHLLIGHLKDWRLTNKHFREDADLIRRQREEAKKAAA